jgi:hypothetical protein
VLSMCSLNCARARSRKEGGSAGGSSQRRVTGHIRWWTCHSVLVLQGGAALASLGISSWKRKKKKDSSCFYFFKLHSGAPGRSPPAERSQWGVVVSPYSTGYTIYKTIYSI